MNKFDRTKKVRVNFALRNKIYSFLLAILLISPILFIYEYNNVYAETEGEWISETTFKVSEGYIQVYAGSMAYFDDVTQKYLPIDTTIIPVSDNDGIGWGVREGTLSATFATSLSQNWHTSITYKSFSLQTKFLSVGYYDSSTDKFRILSDVNTNSNAVVSGNTVTYNNVYGQSDIRITYYSDVVKEELIIPHNTVTNLPLPTSLGLSNSDTWVVGAQRIRVDGLETLTDNEVNDGNFTTSEITLRDIVTGVKLFFPISLAWDSQNDDLGQPNNTVQVKYRLYRNDGNTYLLYGVPYSWIKDTEGEVIIDPTTQIQPPNQDGSINRGAPNNNYAGNAALWVRTWAGGDLRALVDFTWVIPAGSIIQSANVSLYYYAFVGGGGDPVGRTYDVHILTGVSGTGWVEASVTWNNYKVGNAWTTPGGDYSDTDMSSQTVPAGFGWMAWDVTNMIQNYMDNSTSTSNMIFKDNVEVGADQQALFRSADYGVAGDRPKLDIKYIPALTPGEIVSAEAVIANVSTTSNVFTDVTGLSTNIMVRNTSNILIISSIQVNANESAVASYRLVFDNENFQGLTRQVSTSTGNVVLVDLVEAKAAGNYEVKVQHNISNGLLFTVNSSVYAISLHNGNGPIPSNQSFVGSETVSGVADEDIAGLTAEITLQRSSHVWVALSWSGEFSLANKQGNFTIEIDGVSLETRFRKWGAADQWGVLSLISRTNLKLPNGTHTVKGVWSGSAAGTLTGMNFSMVMVAGEANGTVAEFEISKVVVETETTSSNTMENINDLTFDFTTPADSYVMGFLSMDTESSTNNREVFFTININITDDIVMKRDHTLAGSSIASIGQVVRTNSTLSAGVGNMTGRWYSELGAKITGNNIILTAFVLFTEDTGLVYATIYEHTGTNLFFDDFPIVNGTIISVTNGSTIVLTVSSDTGFVFFRHEMFYILSDIYNHSHDAAHSMFMNQDVVHNSFSINVGGGDTNIMSSGDTGSYTILGGIIGGIVAASIGYSMAERRRRSKER